uniref:Uncharacterized protein n=1 Tax=Glossina palpalis gambiensis TaxID=67801 RepID=A0A1B0C3I4_9MUSC
MHFAAWFLCLLIFPAILMLVGSISPLPTLQGNEMSEIDESPALSRITRQSYRRPNYRPPRYRQNRRYYNPIRRPNRRYYR